MRKGEPGRKCFFRAVVIVGGGLIAAIVILYAPWAPLFDLRGIVVIGNRRVPAKTIVSLTGFHKGTNLLQLPIHRATESLLENPWIKTVSIRRIFPHTVSVTIEERPPLAYIKDTTNNETLWTIAEGGIVVEESHNGDHPALLVQGVTLTEEAVRGRLIDGDVVHTLEVFHNQNLHKEGFDLIDFSDTSSVLLHHVTGLEVKLGPTDGIQSRIDALAILLDTLNPENYQRIDLRFGDEAVLVPR